MRHRSPFVPLLLIVAVANAAARGSPPSYEIAPGAPLCAAGDPIVCAWSDAGLEPAPLKYAVEITAGYDPDCRAGADFFRSFSLTSAGADPSIAFAAALLDQATCVSNDDPCSTPGVIHAASVQIRAKALDPPVRGGAQNNPFSAWSAPLSLPGVCASACPQACQTGIASFLAQMETAQQQSGITSSLFCSYDTDWKAGTISFGGYTATGVLPVVQGSALIGVAYCLATINNSGLVDMGLQSAEQAACATQFAPAFAELAGQACDITAP